MAKSPIKSRESASASEESYDEDEANNNASFQKGKLSQVITKPAKTIHDVSTDEIENQESEEEYEIENEDQFEKENFKQTIQNKASAKVPTQLKRKQVTKHPPYQVMIDAALKTLNERKGSSLPAIKKYILANYNNINENRFKFLVYKYIKKAVLDGKLKQNKMKYKLIEVEKKSSIQPKKPATAKKLFTKSSKNNLINIQQDKEKPITSKQTKPQEKADSKGNIAKTAGKPKKVTTKEVSKPKKAQPAKKTTTTIKSVNKPNSNDEIASTSNQSIKKKVIKKPAKPTLKIATSAVRKSLSLVKKKPGAKKANGNVEVSTAVTKNPKTVSEKTTRPVRGANKKANN